VESTNHMLFYCRIAWLVWNQCYTCLGIASVGHVVPTTHFLYFILLNAPVQVNVVWNCVWIAVPSKLWKHRNKHIFQGGGDRSFESVHFGTIKCLVLGNF